MKTYKMIDYTYPDGSVLPAAVSTIDGGYLGDEKYAILLEKRGIAPQCINETHTVCSIGFCEDEQKWYGWSHRAMFGFGIGSEVKKGDCAYQPVDKDDFAEDCARFWSDENKHPLGVEHVTQDGKEGVRVNWMWDDKVPNKSLHGKLDGIFTPYPEKWGRGEWVAGTLEDAKQMAIDFANDVA